MNINYFDHLKAGWFGVNVLVPVVGPLFALWLISKFKKVAHMTKNLAIKSIGKGELLWSVMGMAAAAIYELDGIKSIATDEKLIDVVGWATGGHIGIIVISVLMVGFNSLEPVATGTAPPPPPPQVPDKFIFGSSILGLILVIITYSGVHSKLTEQEEIAHKTAIMKAQECIAKTKGDAKLCVEGMK